MAKKDPSKEIHTCCICGCKFTGWGNNPYGALDKNGNVINWNPNDVCCNECDGMYVLSGRLYLHNQACKEAKKK